MLWLILLILIYLLAVFPHHQDASPRTGYYAHRGYYTQDQSVAENSLEAYRRAIHLGVGIELDIQFSADETIYVFHDADLKRMFGINKKFSEMTDAQLNALDLHGQHIPTFSEVLALVKGQTDLIVELKTQGAKNHKLVDKAMEQLSGYAGSYCVESFDPRIVARFRRHYPQVIRGQLVMKARDYQNIGLGLVMSSYLPNLWTRPDFMAAECHVAAWHPGLFLFHVLGGNTIAWTVHEADDARCKQRFDAMIFEHYEPKVIKH